jgi:hypothetical protein
LILVAIFHSACVAEFTQLRHRETTLLMDGIAISDERLDPFRVAGHVVGVFSVPTSGDVELAVGVYGGLNLPSFAVQSARLTVGSVVFEFPENRQRPTIAPIESEPLRGYISLGVVEDEALRRAKNGEPTSLALILSIANEVQEFEFSLEPYTYRVLPSG